jgi:transcriptional regulator with XRE-family HTH domain
VERGLNQKQLADLMKARCTQIGFIEQRKRNPTIVNIIKIARALKISLSDLFKDL